MTILMKNTAIAAVAALGLMAETAHAATFDITKDYGLSTGSPTSGANGTLGNDYVTVLDRVDDNGQRFLQKLGFSGLGGTINSITLSLDYAFAPIRTGLFLGFFPFSEERWSVYGSTDGTTNSATRDTIGTLNSDARTTWSATFNSGAVFDQAVDDGEFKFWFGDGGSLPNDFRLYGAELSVEYDASPVPLPAAGFLLIGALGGLIALRRRRAA